MSWWSANRAKRGNEALVLAFSPLWMVAMAVVMLTRSFTRWGDLGHMILGGALALPLWIVPFVVERDRPLLERHATRFAVWIAVVTFLQTYFGTLFFFNSLGMEYHFTVTLFLHGTPVFLYFVTIAYFSTYYVLLQLALRGFAARFPTAPRWLSLLVRVVVCYSVAFGETFFMASDGLKPYFLYRDKTFTLIFGSLCYATVFLATLPLIARLDEASRPQGSDDPPRPSLPRIVWDALAANLAVLLIYEVLAAVIEHLRHR